jgi:hypothetical protein
MPLNTAQEQAEHLKRMELMQSDLDLKRKQTAWETPRNIALLAGTIAVIVGTIAGVLGYKIGAMPQPVPQIIFQPGSIQVLPK